MSAENASSNLVAQIAEAELINRNFWFRWTVATTLGWLFGVLILGIEVIRLSVEVITYITIAAAFASMFGAFMATSFGLAQGMILRKYGFSAREWTIASCIGGVIGGIVSDVVFYVIYRFTPSLPAASWSSVVWSALLMATAGAANGGIVGYWQGNLLQRYGFSRSYWAKSCAIGWMIGCLISEIFGHFLLGTMIWPLAVIETNSDKVVLVVLSVTCGLIGGAITGYPIMRALQQSKNPNSEI